MNPSTYDTGSYGSDNESVYAGFDDEFVPDHGLRTVARHDLEFRLISFWQRSCRIVQYGLLRRIRPAPIVYEIDEISSSWTSVAAMVAKSS